MWQFLKNKEYMVGDSCELNEDESVSTPMVNNCPNQTKAIAIRDKPTVIPQNPHHKAEQNLANRWIYNVILMRAFRQQRTQNENLRELVEHHDSAASKVKKELHIYKTLLRIGQKSNAELENKLKIAVVEEKDVRVACDSLTTMLITLEAKHSLIEQALESKDRELKSLYLQLEQIKVELLMGTCEEQELRSAIDEHQKRRESLEAERDKLAYELGNEKLKVQKKFCQELEKRCKNFIEADEKIKKLEAHQKALIAELDAVKVNVQTIEQLESENEALRMQMALLQRTVDDLPVGRCAYFWDVFNRYKANVVELIVLVGFLMLPALPEQHKLRAR